MSKREAMRMLKMLAKEPQHDEVEKIQFALDKRDRRYKRDKLFVSDESDALGYIKGTLAAHHECIKRIISELEKSH